jgi:molybdopterin synthase catalytic subunit
MLVRVRLFAQLRERAGRREVELELAEGARVSDALSALADIAGGLPVAMAVNRTYAPQDAVLRAGDELALIPPVSGGSGEAVEPARADAESRGLSLVRAERLSLDAVTLRVHDPRAGAIVTFSGVTRDVPHLDYEAYAEMAGAEIERIVAAAVERHGLCAAAAEHRVGRVPLGEASVVVAASAPHRAEAFAGAREVIDEIKARAPVWKREEGAWKEGTSAPRRLTLPPPALVARGPVDAVQSAVWTSSWTFGWNMTPAWWSRCAGRRPPRAQRGWAAASTSCAASGRCKRRAATSSCCAPRRRRAAPRRRRWAPE